MPYDPTLVPPGSHLERYARQSDPRFEDVQLEEGAWMYPWSELYSWSMRVLAASIKLREEPRLHRHDPAFLQYNLVLPALRKVGFPEKYLDRYTPPGCVCALVEYAIPKLIEASRSGRLTDEMQSYSLDPLLIEVKAVVESLTGKPFDERAKPLVFPTWEERAHDTIITAAYRDTLAFDLPDDKRFEQVADRLGPGISADHVRLTLAKIGSRIGALSEDDEALVRAAISCMSELMRDIDKADGYSKPKN